jgi:hypothetical protein
MGRRICYVVHWAVGDVPESRIYLGLGESLVKFMSELKASGKLSSGPILERIVLTELTRAEKKTLRRIQDGV